MTTRTTLSSFVQAPTRVIARLDEGDVVLTRREGEDLRLSVDARVEREAAAFGHAAEVVGLVARAASEQRRDAVRAVFPWTEVLAPEELAQFAEEYFSALRASASLRTFAPLETVESAWLATARLKADPELRARIEQRLAEAEPVRAGRPEPEERPPGAASAPRRGR